MTRQELIRCFIVIGALVCFTCLAGCRRQEAVVKDADASIYVCAMHPWVKSHNRSAKCPICGMSLVPLPKNGALAMQHDSHAGDGGTMKSGSGASEFYVPLKQQWQYGVTYIAVEWKPLRRILRAVGKVTLKKTRQWDFIARTDGYVQDLQITSRGETVDAGQPLLTMSSPDLFTAEREYVNLLVARDHAASQDATVSMAQAIEAGYHRLEQRAITAQQIAELEKSRKPSEIITFNSPCKGVVEDIAVDQGARVMAGDRLVSVADLTEVSVWAEFYEDELSMLTKGQKVKITADAYPGQVFDGELNVIDPFLTEIKRTVRGRIDILNPDLKLRPGMYVNVELAVDMGEGLTIPASAVMPTGSRNLVFVKKEEGRLEPRFVQLGQQYGDNYAVLDGLQAGESVVAGATFLIDSESKVQGAGSK